MADSKVESSGELSAKELKEKKQAEETENVAANGKTEEEDGEQENEVEDEEDVGEEEDGEGDEEDDEEDDLDGPFGKRAAEDDYDEEDEVETKKRKTDK